MRLVLKGSRASKCLGIRPNFTLREPRQPLVNLTGDDIPDVLVGMLSQTGFKVMQKCNFYQLLIFYLFINITGWSILSKKPPYAISYTLIC